MLDLSYQFSDQLSPTANDVVTFTRDAKTLQVKTQNDPFTNYQSHNWNLSLRVIKPPMGEEVRQVTLTSPYCGMYSYSVPVFPSNIWPRGVSHQKGNEIWLNALGSSNPKGEWMKFDAKFDPSHHLVSLSNGNHKIIYSGWQTVDGYSFPTQIHETNYEFYFHKCEDLTWSLKSANQVSGTIDVVKDMGSPITITDLRLMPKAHYAWSFRANKKMTFWQSVNRMEGLPGDPAYPSPSFAISVPKFSLSQWLLILGFIAIAIGLFMKYKENLFSLLRFKKAK